MSSAPDIAEPGATVSANAVTEPTDASSLALSPRPADALPVYVDYNATTPLSEACVAAMTPFLTAGVSSSTLFGNASSSHVFGASARTQLEHARAQVARCINAAHAREVMFMSGATESLNTALQGAAYAQRARGLGTHIISSSFEHIATLEILKALEADGFVVTLLPVDANGSISPEQVAAALRPDTVLVSLMLANNEVGSVLPLAAIARVIRSSLVVKEGGRRVWLHTDASQALGKIEVDVQALDVDMLTIAGHKIYASKGIGALYVREDTVAAQGGLRKFMIGANHEQNRRAGTENVQLIAGLGAACQDITDHLPELMRSFAGMRDGLLASIRAHLATLIQAHKLSDRYTVETTAGAPAAAASSSASTPRPAFVVHCAGTNRLSNTLSIGFHGVSASEILHRLRGHVAASAGAACHADAVSLSYVLSSMRVDPAYGMGTLRLSVGRYNTARELEEQVGPWIAKVVVQLWLEQRAKSETDAVGNYARVSAH